MYVSQCLSVNAVNPVVLFSGQSHEKSLKSSKSEHSDSLVQSASEHGMKVSQFLFVCVVNMVELLIAHVQLYRVVFSKCQIQKRSF